MQGFGFPAGARGCAGIAWAATLDTWEPEGFALLRAVNVDGTIHAIQAVMAGIKARHYGRIVNISSVASFGTACFPGNHCYASTKAEVNILTRRFALELAPSTCLPAGLRDAAEPGRRPG